MKRFIIILLITGFQSICTFGQSATDSISIGTKRGDIKCYQHNKLLTNMDYNFLFKENPVALTEMKKARHSYTAGKVFGYIGGFVFGFCLGSAISGDAIDYTWWWTLGTSAAVAGSGFIIYNSGKKHHINAVNEYNSALRATSQRNLYRIEFGVMNNGLGFALKF